MFKFLLFFGLIAMALTGFAQAPSATPKAVITFEKSTHDFGDITQGDVVSHTFKFKNTGNAPLIISDVQVTCGCTVPTKPKEPIMPGKSSEIGITFNSGGKIGKNNKTITVISNASNTEERISIVTNILAPKN
jgi:Protein of unknown function (DUF1573)